MSTVHFPSIAGRRAQPIHSWSRTPSIGLFRVTAFPYIGSNYGPFVPVGRSHRYSGLLCGFDLSHRDAHVNLSAGPWPPLASSGGKAGARQPGDESLIDFDSLYSAPPRTKHSSEIPFSYPAALPDTPIGVNHFATATLDQRGRLSDRSTIRKLNWEPGSGIALTAHEHAVAAELSEDARWKIGPTGYLHIASAIRRRCGIRAGDRLLLVASLTLQRLVVYTAAAVAVAMSQLAPHLWEPK